MTNTLTPHTITKFTQTSKFTSQASVFLEMLAIIVTLYVAVFYCMYMGILILSAMAQWYSAQKNQCKCEKEESSEEESDTADTELDATRFELVTKCHINITGNGNFLRRENYKIADQATKTNKCILMKKILARNDEEISLSQRMDVYREVSASYLTPEDAYVVTLKLAGFKKLIASLPPKHKNLIFKAMTHTTHSLLSKFNAILTYTDGSEIIMEFAKSQNPMYGGNIQKIVSTVASYCNLNFANTLFHEHSFLASTTDTDLDFTYLLKMMDVCDFMFEGSVIVFPPENNHDLEKYFYMKVSTTASNYITRLSKENDPGLNIDHVNRSELEKILAEQSVTIDQDQMYGIITTRNYGDDKHITKYNEDYGFEMWNYFN